MDLIKWYKEQTEKNLTDPPESVWDNIQEELDVNDVWKRIYRHLNRSRLLYYGKRAGLYAAISGMLILLGRTYDNMGGFSANQSNSYITQKSPLGNSYNPVSINDSVQTKNTAFVGSPSSSKQSVKTESPPSDQTKSVKEGKDTLQFVSRRKIDKIQHSSAHKDIRLKLSGTDDYLSVQRIPGRMKKQDYLYLTYVDENYTDLSNSNLGAYRFQADKAGDLDIQTLPNFYVGISSKIQNTWLLNNTTFRGLQSDEMTKTVPVFVNDFAVYVGMDITDRVMMMVETNFSMQNQQKYYEYSHGHYVSKKIQLNYSTINAQLKYNFHRFFENNALRANFIIGAYGGMLQYGKLKTGDVTQSVNNQYEKYDFGFLVGYEFEIRLFNQITLNPGVQYRQGLVNIYKGNGYIPASFNKTYPATIDFNLGLSYIIK